MLKRLHNGSIIFYAENYKYLVRTKQTAWSRNGMEIYRKEVVSAPTIIHAVSRNPDAWSVTPIN